jgi:hypothetical protein
MARSGEPPRECLGQRDLVVEALEGSIPQETILISL